VISRRGAPFMRGSRPAERVGALKLDMQRFTDAGAIFRSPPELRTPPELVDAVLRASRDQGARRYDPARSRIALSRWRSLRFARRIAVAITGAVTFANPAGSPRLRSDIRVAPSPTSSQV
jgi:hypothetical protein